MKLTPTADVRIGPLLTFVAAKHSERTNIASSAKQLPRRVEALEQIVADGLTCFHFDERLDSAVVDQCVDFDLL